MKKIDIGELDKARQLKKLLADRLKQPAIIYNADPHPCNTDNRKKKSGIDEMIKLKVSFGFTNHGGELGGK